MTDVHTCHERTARWCAHGAARVMLGKGHALIRQTVEIRSLEVGLAVAAQVPVAEVIREDVNDIRCPASKCECRQNGESENANSSFYEVFSNIHVLSVVGFEAKLNQFVWEIITSPASILVEELGQFMALMHQKALFTVGEESEEALQPCYLNSSHR